MGCMSSENALPAFGPRLRRQRRALGIKQTELAQDLGLDQTTISRWEAGHIVPDKDIQLRTFSLLSRGRRDNGALRRLIETSATPVHLVDETSHICLAYSKSRAKDWQTSQRQMLGVSLWQFATDEIRQAEGELADSDWWSAHTPAPKRFCTSAAYYPNGIHISAGGILWERLYLADGTPVRLVNACVLRGD